MSKLEIVEVSKKELESGQLPFNHVLVETQISSEGLKSKGGVIVGFSEDLCFAEGDDAHNANLVIPYGIVYKVPDKLYYDEDDPNSMPYRCEMELQKGDTVWFSIMESYNAITLKCEGKYYKLLPYADCFVAKRKFHKEVAHGITYYTPQKEEVIVLNGNTLCQTINKTKISELDPVSEGQIDTTKVIVRYVGKPNTEYKTKGYVDHQDLQPNDLVLLQPRTPMLFLERKKWTAQFDGDNLYIVIPRRKIVARLNER